MQNKNRNPLDTISKKIHSKATEYRKKNKGVFIVGICGSVSVGKTTTSQNIKNIIKTYNEMNNIEVVSSDSFLLSLKELSKKNILQKKGFPETYNTKLMIDFINQVKRNKSKILSPIYSQIKYDIIKDQQKEIGRPEILIIEGLNTLQKNCGIKDMLDYKIYIDAKSNLIKKWYIKRFIDAKQNQFTDPKSYFYSISKMTNKKAIEVGINYWKKINYKNLKMNILPTKKYADMVIKKTKKHFIKKIKIKN